jgi:hypothetical protein
MIQVTIGTAASRRTVSVEPTATIRSVLENEGVNYQQKSVALDGVNLGIGDFDKTFAELNITEKAYLIALEKQVAA